MRPLVFFFALLLTLTSCSDTSEPNAPSTPSTLEGTITDVTIEENAVVAFEMETTEGETQAVVIDEDADYGFDLFHLQDHADSADPVVVEVKEEGGELVALSIEDV